MAWLSSKNPLATKGARDSTEPVHFVVSRFLGSSCKASGVYLPLVSREWKNGSNSSYNCTPFLHSPLTKGKFRVERFGASRLQRAGVRGSSLTVLGLQTWSFASTRNPKPQSFKPGCTRGCSSAVLAKLRMVCEKVDDEVGKAWSSSIRFVREPGILCVCVCVLVLLKWGLGLGIEGLGFACRIIKK